MLSLANKGEVTPQNLGDTEVWVKNKILKFKIKIRNLMIELDKKMSKQLSAIVEHRSFQQMESRWRGLYSLTQVQVNPVRCKLKVLCMSWAELSVDLDQVSTIEKTILYRLIAEKELNTMGGEPFGLIVLDHELSLNVAVDYDESYILDVLADIGSRCLCPFVMNTAFDFFGYDSADWISDVERLRKILSGQDFQGLRDIASRKSSRFIALTMNFFQIHRGHALNCRYFDYRPEESRYAGLWTGTQYLFASTVLLEFERTGWFGYLKMVGNERGIGAVPDVLEYGAPKQVSVHEKVIPRYRITASMGEFFSSHGFIPLVDSRLYRDCFFSGNSTLNAKNSTPRERMLSQVQSILISCRVAHFVKVLMRKLIGQSLRREEVQDIIERWLEPYVSPLSSASAELLARHPLRQVSVEVQESKMSGEFYCELLVVPQYQIDRLLGEIRLQTAIET